MSRSKNLRISDSDLNKAKLSTNRAFNPLSKHNDNKFSKKIEEPNKSSLRGQHLNKEEVNVQAPTENENKIKANMNVNTVKIQGQMIIKNQSMKQPNPCVNLMNNSENKDNKNKNEIVEKQLNFHELASKGETKNTLNYEKITQNDHLYKSYELSNDDENIKKVELKKSISNDNSSDSKFYLNKSNNLSSYKIPPTNFTENKKIEENSKTSSLHNLQRITLMNPPIFSKQNTENFVYARNLGDNQFKALSLLFIEQLIISQNIETFMHYLDYFKSENFQIFKLNKYLKYFSNEKQIECQKSWDSLILLMEAYLDRRLQNKEENLLIIVYEFYCEVEIDKKNIALAMNLLSRGIMAKAALQSYSQTQNDFNCFYKMEERICTEYDLKLFPYASYYNLKFYPSENYYKEFKSKENFENNYLNMIRIKDEYYSLYKKMEKMREPIPVFFEHDINLQNDIYEKSYKEKTPIPKNQEYKDLHSNIYMSEFCCLCIEKIEDNKFFMNNCKHIYCLDCIRKKCGNYGFKCFYFDCPFELDAANLLSFITENDFLLDQKQKVSNKKCRSCQTEKKENELFTNSKCLHDACINCLYEKGSYSCPIQGCNQSVDKVKYKEFELSISEKVEKNIKMCDLCKKEETTFQFFKNLECNHLYCMSCIEKQKPRYCIIKNCNIPINQDMIEDFKKNAQTSTRYSQCYNCQTSETKESFFSCEPSDFHKFCYKCSQILLKKKESNFSYVPCPAQNCLGFFEVKKLINYLNLHKLNQNESIGKKILNKDEATSISKSIKNEKINSVACDKCHYLENKNNCFINPDCNHILCLECCKQKYNKSLPQKLSYSQRYYQPSSHYFCDIQYCCKNFEFEGLQTFLMNANSSLEEKTNKLVECEKQCFKCKKSSNVFVQLGGEVNYYKCEYCKEVMCYIHRFELEKCFCFCKKCLSKTEANPIIPYLRTCVDCKMHFCLLCAKELSNCICYCQMCFELLENNKNKFCEICENQCHNCKDKIDKEAFVRMEGCKKQHKICFKCYFKNSYKDRLKWSSVREEDKSCFICKNNYPKNL